MIDHHKFKEVLLNSLQYPEPQYGQYGQRAVADILEAKANQVLQLHFDTIPARSRRSVEDITVSDCYVDHKTTDEALSFKMPNLISVARLFNLDKPLYYNFIVYNSEQKLLIDCMLVNVYQLNWDHLKIANLGAGQLQIANMKQFLQSPTMQCSESEWVDRLKFETIKFYRSLITKTQNRLDRIIHK